MSAYVALGVIHIFVAGESGELISSQNYLRPGDEYEASDAEDKSITGVTQPMIPIITISGIAEGSKGYIRQMQHIGVAVKYPS